MLKLYFLGDTQYENGAGCIFKPKLRRKTRAVLAHLCLAEKPLSRDHLAALFCQTSDDPTGSLRWHISRIRRDLDDTILLIHDNYIQVNPACVWIDTKAFSHVLSATKNAEDSNALEQILELYRGELLADMSLRDGADFELWLLGQRSHYMHLFEQYSLHLVQLLIQQGAYHKARYWVQKLQRYNPLLEDGHYWLMWLYARVGQAQIALQQYTVYENLMRQEFGAKPSRRIDELRQSIERNQLPEYTHCTR